MILKNQIYNRLFRGEVFQTPVSIFLYIQLMTVLRRQFLPIVIIMSWICQMKTLKKEKIILK